MFEGTPEMYDDTPVKDDNTPEKYDDTPDAHDDKPPLVCLKQCQNNDDSHHRYDESWICMTI